MVKAQCLWDVAIKMKSSIDSTNMLFRVHVVAVFASHTTCHTSYAGLAILRTVILATWQGLVIEVMS